MIIINQRLIQKKIKMNYNFSDYEESDNIGDFKFNFGQKIINSEVGQYNANTPLFGYDYIDLDKTEYHFKQTCFDNFDSTCYFEKVKKLSSISINDLINKSSFKEHFHFYPYPKGKLKELLNQVSKKGLKDEEIPTVGQFALYTKENADRNSNIKSPRIYFMLGPYAVFYILFYDPYHEINKKVENKGGK